MINAMMIRYFDPEYDRIVTEADIRRQFNYFYPNEPIITANSQQRGHYEDFRERNFRKCKKYIIFAADGSYWHDTDELETAEIMTQYGGHYELQEGRP